LLAKWNESGEKFKIKRDRRTPVKMIYFTKSLQNSGMTMNMENVIMNGMEYGHSDDGENMMQHLQAFETSLKMGNPKDALRALVALKDGGFQLPSGVVEEEEVVAASARASAPVPRFATYIPQWNRDAMVGRTMTGAELTKAVAGIEVEVATVKAVEVEAVEVEAVEVEAVEVEAVEVEVAAKVAPKPACSLKRQATKVVVAAAGGLSNDRKKLVKKLKESRKLLDVEGKPKAGLDADQLAKVERIAGLEKELEVLDKQAAARQARGDRRDLLMKGREDAQRIQDALAGPVIKSPEKKKAKSEWAWKTGWTWNVPIGGVCGEIEVTVPDAVESESDDDDEMVSGPMILRAKTTADKPKQESLIGAAMREQENPLLDGDDTGEWTTTVKQTRQATGEKQQQCAHFGLTGVVSRWNGRNGHVMTRDIETRGATHQTGVYFEGQDVDGEVDVGVKLKFDAANSERGGLKGFNCRVLN